MKAGNEKDAFGYEGVIYLEERKGMKVKEVKKERVCITHTFPHMRDQKIFLHVSTRVFTPNNSTSTCPRRECV